MKMPTGEHALKERNRSSLSGSALTAASCVAPFYLCRLLNRSTNTATFDVNISG